MCWKGHNPFPLLMVSLIVCAHGLAVVLTRIGYSLGKPLPPVSSSSCSRKETNTHKIHRGRLPIPTQLRMVSHICGFELASNRT